MNKLFHLKQLIIILFVVTLALAIRPALADPQPKSKTTAQCKAFWNTTTVSKKHKCTGEITANNDPDWSGGYFCNIKNQSCHDKKIKIPSDNVTEFYDSSINKGGDVCLIKWNQIYITAARPSCSS